MIALFLTRHKLNYLYKWFKAKYQFVMFTVYTIDTIKINFIIGG